ncbi:MAG: hypothetical protein ACEQSX_18555, partial [Baekduiaceae bacterium]
MLRIGLLGAESLESDGVPLTPPAGRPARALLGWLALHPGLHPRGDLASRLWPDVLDTSARASLRSAAWALRGALGPAAPRREGDRARLGLRATPCREEHVVRFEGVRDRRALLLDGDRVSAVLDHRRDA